MKEKIDFRLKMPKTLKVIGTCGVHNCEIYQCTGKSRNECEHCDVRKICNDGKRCGQCNIEWLSNQHTWIRNWRMNYANLINEKMMELRKMAKKGDDTSQLEAEIAEAKKNFNEGPKL